jgi:SNF2 family DNA or RNA helicase
MPEWESALQRFAPDVQVHFLHGDPDIRMSMLQETLGPWLQEPEDERKRPLVILTTYEIVIKDEYLSQIVGFCYVIVSAARWVRRSTPVGPEREDPGVVSQVDEAQRLKNKNSHLFRSLRNVPSKHRLLMTGTPLQVLIVIEASLRCQGSTRSVASVSCRRMTLGSSSRY